MSILYISALLLHSSVQTSVPPNIKMASTQRKGIASGLAHLHQGLYRYEVMKKTIGMGKGYDIILENW